MKTKHGKEARGTFCNASVSVVPRSFLGQRKRNSQNRQSISITKVYQMLLAAHFGLPHAANSEQRTANSQESAANWQPPKADTCRIPMANVKWVTLRFRFVNETGN